MMMLIFLLVYVVLYFVFTYPMYLAAKKLGDPNPWYAFVPILNIVQLLTLTGKELWWIILFFIPIVGLVVAIIVLMDLAVRLNRPNFYGILFCIPIVGSFLLYQAATE